MEKIHFKTIIISGLIIFMTVQCKVNLAKRSHGPANKKTPALEAIPFIYPDDITEAGKADFVKTYNKGHILYNINCAKCHNKTQEGKQVIPDFSLPQLMDYEIRIQYPDHQDPMRETNLSQEELDQVITFLRYKKRNS
jgi:hypothetical protein